MPENTQDNDKQDNPAELASKIAATLGVTKFGITENPSREVIYIAIENLSKIPESKLRLIEPLLDEFESDFEEIILTEL